MAHRKLVLGIAVSAAATIAALAPAVAAQAAAPTAASRAAAPAAYVLYDYFTNSLNCDNAGRRMEANGQISDYYCVYVPREGVALYVQY